MGIAFINVTICFGVFIQLFKFTSFFIKDIKLQLFAFFLIIVDPTLSTQFVIVNPEVILIFFFFLSVNGILYKRKRLQFLGLFFLSIVSFRSMMLFAGLFLFDILNRIFLKKEKLKTILNLKFLLFYFFASLPGILFVAWRLLTKGWLQTHPDSPWAGLWQLATLKIFFKNCIVLLWRYLDFGKSIFISMFSFFYFLFWKKNYIN